MADDVEFGHVVDLTLGEPAGTELVADAAIGATSLLVDYAGDFEDTGEVVLNDEVIAYTAITYGDLETDPDTIALAAPLAAAAVTDDRVGIVSGGEPVVDWALHVSLGDGHPVEIPIPFEQRAMWSTVDVSTPVPVFVSADLERLVEVPGRTPVIDGASVDASTLDTSTMPPPPLTDGDAPDNATTVTPIGGIGSMFYRWTEITNADPVTYRLHVRAGSAPTTDGTYEVAAGVGLTSAAVRKLKDGTAIVGDGSVTYHAVVTVEDADGPGPASADVTGTPAQVTSADIAVNAITANLLTANDAFIDALNATDFTGVTMTAPIIRTVASGRRVELSGPNNWLGFYSGSGSEQLPGYMEADVVGNFARLIIAAPDPDESDKAQTTYRNMILMSEDVTDVSATRVSRNISLRTSHLYIETAAGDFIHFDGAGGTPQIDWAGSDLFNFTMKNGDVGVNTFRDSVRAAIVGDYAAGAWGTSWTPTWTAATTNPALGNGTMVGRYIQTAGKTVHFYINLTMGSTTTYGTGGWRLDLPVTELGRRFTFRATAFDTSAGQHYDTTAIRTAVDTLRIFCDPTTAGAAMRDATPTIPFTWADGDQLHISGTYEAA